MQDCYIAWLLRLWKIDDLYSFSLFMCIFVDLRIMHYACPLVTDIIFVHALWIFVRDEIRSKMKSKYLSNPDYNYEKVNRASLACGPMVKWAIAQVCKMKV